MSCRAAYERSGSKVWSIPGRACLIVELVEPRVTGVERSRQFCPEAHDTRTYLVNCGNLLNSFIEGKKNQFIHCADKWKIKMLAICCCIDWTCEASKDTFHIILPQHPNGDVPKSDVWWFWAMMFRKLSMPKENWKKGANSTSGLITDDD
jgi:hypothetical protein